VLEIEEDTTTLQKEIHILSQCTSPYIVAYRGAYRKDSHIWVRRCCGAFIRSMFPHAPIGVCLPCLTSDRYGVLRCWVHLRHHGYL